jgi:hypothetical protein
MAVASHPGTHPYLQDLLHTVLTLDVNPALVNSPACWPRKAAVGLVNAFDQAVKAEPPQLVGHAALPAKLQQEVNSWVDQAKLAA